MNYKKPAVAVLLIGGLCVSIVFARGDQKVTLNETPPAVQAAVKKLAGESKVDSINKEVDISYEVQFKIKGEDHTATISEDGKLEEDDVDLELAAVPANIKAAVNREFPKGKIETASRVTEGGSTHYELDVKVGTHMRSLEISTDGKVTSNEPAEE